MPKIDLQRGKIKRKSGLHNVSVSALVHRTLWFSEEMHVNGIMGPFRKCIDPKTSAEKNHQRTATKSKYPLHVV